MPVLNGNASGSSSAVVRWQLQSPQEPAKPIHSRSNGTIPITDIPTSRKFQDAMIFLAESRQDRKSKRRRWSSGASLASSMRSGMVEQFSTPAGSEVSSVVVRFYPSSLSSVQNNGGGPAQRLAPRNSLWKWFSGAFSCKFKRRIGSEFWTFIRDPHNVDSLQALCDIAEQSLQGREAVIRRFTRTEEVEVKCLRALFNRAELETVRGRPLPATSPVARMLRILTRHGHLFDRALPLILRQQQDGVAGLLVIVEKKGEHVVGHNGLASLDPMLLHLAHISEYAPVGSSRWIHAVRLLAALMELQVGCDAIAESAFLRDALAGLPRKLSSCGGNQLMIDAEVAQTAVLQFLYTLRYVDPRRPPLEWYNSGSGIDEIIDTVVNQRNDLTVRYLGLAALRVLLGRATVRDVILGRRDLVDYCLDIAVDGADQGWKDWQDDRFEDTTLGTIELPKLYPEDDAHEILTDIVDSSHLLDSIRGKWTAIKVSILPRMFFMRSVDMLVTEVDGSGNLTPLALKFVEAGIIEFFLVILRTEVPMDDAHREYRDICRALTDTSTLLGRLREKAGQNDHLREALNGEELRKLLLRRSEDKSMPRTLQNASAFALGSPPTPSVAEPRRPTPPRRSPLID